MNNMLRFPIVRSAAGLLVGSFFLLDVSVAAPSISYFSGNVTHGELARISGSGFGTRANYNNIGDTWNGHRYLNFRWTDFSFSTFPSQSSYNSNPTQSDGFYPQRGGAWWDAWSTSGLSLESGGPSVSRRYLKRRYAVTESGGASVYVPDAADNYNYLFIQADFMMASTTNVQQSGKAFRVYGDGPAGSIYVTSGGASSMSLRGDGSVEDCQSGFNGDGVRWGGNYSFQLGKWDQVTLGFDKSSGFVSAFINNQFQWQNKWWCGFGLGGHTIDIPNMIDGESRGGGTDGSYNYANVYIDFTKARVVLGNSSTYAASTRMEPQLPVVWTPTSIEFAVNSGTFSNGDIAYIYVFDETGLKNESGYKVTIGGGDSGDSIGGGDSNSVLSPPSNLMLK